MLGYAVAEHDDMKKMEELKNNIGWIKSVGVLGTSIKNVYKSPIKNKESNVQSKLARTFKKPC